MKWPWTRAPLTPPEPRRDGWENAFTGLGVLGADKRLGSDFSPDLVAQETADDIWRGDDLASIIIEDPPREMYREGFELVAQNDKEASEALDDECKRLALTEQLEVGERWARAYGGCGLYLGVDDGLDPSEPLNEANIRRFDFIQHWSPREMQPIRYYSDPMDSRYGEPQVYRLVPLYTPLYSPADNIVMQREVHASRVIRLEGVATSRRARFTNVQPGWEDSVLVRVGQVVNDFQHAWQGIAILLADFSVTLLKLKGFAQLVAACGADALAKRATALELTRSIARVAIVDADGEDYARQSTPVAGLGEVMDRFMNRLAGAAQMPVSRLFGQAPAGLNATGDSDIRWYYDRIKAHQLRRKKAIERVCQLAMLAKEGPFSGRELDYEIRFRPLWQASDKEQAETRKTQADADAAYITAQVLAPEEVRQSRFGGDVYSSETHLDPEVDAAREALEEAGESAGQEHAEQENAPDGASSKKLAQPEIHIKVSGADEAKP